MIKLADLSQQHLELSAQIDAAIQNVIVNNTFINGPEVNQFESEFAEFCETPYCVGVANGTDALEIAIEALALPPGSEILLQSNSFVASAEAIIRNGHRPVFLDCKITDHSVSLNSALDSVGERTRAILVAHMFGIPANMDEVMQFATQHDLIVIEDCAQAHGAKWRGRNVGSFGQISTFSFFPGKNLGALGDAGAICTSDKTLAKTCRMIANHGRENKYTHERLGRNSRLDTLQAAVLSVKLKQLSDWNQARLDNAIYLSKGLKGLNQLEVIYTEECAVSVYHQFVVKYQYRDQLKEKLTEAGIQWGIHYPQAINDYLPFSSFHGETPNAKHLADTMLSIPVHQYLQNDKLDYIVSVIKRSCSEIEGRLI